jgi:iron complex transport system permease protein
MAQAPFRWLFLLGLLLALNAALLFIHLLVGERSVSPQAVLSTVLGCKQGEYTFAVCQHRLPRALTAFLVGCLLALSGAVLQLITRNPLASPGVIGLNGGAAAAVVAVIVLAPAWPVSVLPFVAFAGAFSAAAAIYLLSWKKGIATSRMLIIGIGISAMTAAIVTYLLTVGNIFSVTQASIWMAGSLYGRTWAHFWPLLPWLLIVLPLLLLLARTMDLFQLADASTRSLGVPIETMRFILLLLAVCLAGAAVSMAGTIPFVGLMAPHMAYRLTGSQSLKRLPVAALLGGLLVLIADLAGRMLFSPFEIPAGLITAVVGAPYMIYLLFRPKRIQ